MPDIYNRVGQQYNGSFSAESTEIVFSGGGTDLISASGGVGLLTQSLNVGYTQQVSRFYELGTNFVYLVRGQAQGQAGLNRILGPRPLQLAFYAKYGDVCNAANNNLTLLLGAGCSSTTNIGPSGQTALLVKTLVLTYAGLSVSTADFVINEQLQAMFISLEGQS